MSSTTSQGDPGASEDSSDGDGLAAKSLGQVLGEAASRKGLTAQSSQDAPLVVWTAMGGWRGIAESILPGLAFVVLFTITLDPQTQQANLWLSLGVSVGLAAVFTLVRLIQKSPPAAAIGGLVATVLAAALALWTGRGENNFLLGFFTNGIYGTALLVSALIGWSLIGLAGGYLRGEGLAWREDPRAKRVYFWLTVAWALLFFIRLSVQLPLYFSGDVVTLGILKLVMGLPLFAPMLAVTVLAVRSLPPLVSREQSSSST